MVTLAVAFELILPLVSLTAMVWANAVGAARATTQAASILLILKPAFISRHSKIVCGALQKPHLRGGGGVFNPRSSLLYSARGRKYLTLHIDEFEILHREFGAASLRQVIGCKADRAYRDWASR